MFRKPNNDSLVYKILNTLCKSGTIVLMNDYTIRISYLPDLGILRITSPVRVIINRMFKLTNEFTRILNSDIKIYEQEYVLDKDLMDKCNRIYDLKAYYESEFLRFR